MLEALIEVSFVDDIIEGSCDSSRPSQWIRAANAQVGTNLRS